VLKRRSFLRKSVVRLRWKFSNLYLQSTICGDELFVAARYEREDLR